MPINPTDFQKTIIYRIVCRDISVKECYVGHTTHFIKRRALHKFCCNTPTNKNYNSPVYKFIRENGGWDNWNLVEIEKYPCDDKNAACARERYWIETLGAQLNTVSPIQTLDERREYEKEYYATNKEVILNYKKDYYEINKEAVLEQQKEYYEKNKVARLKTIKEYYEKNKEKINKDTIVCDCGCTVTKVNILRHRRSVKHTKLLEQNATTPPPVI